MKKRIATLLLIIPIGIVDLLKLPMIIIYWMFTGEYLSSNLQDLVEKNM